MLCFIDKIEIRLLGLEKKRKLPAMKSDAGCEQVWDVAGLRDTEVAGSNCDGKQRKGGNHVDVDREEMGCRSASLAVCCDIAGPIAAKQRKNERKQSNGYFVSIYCVSAGSNDTLEHSRALRLQGRRPLVQCAGALARLETGEVAGISLEIYSGERKDAEVATTVSALAGRLVLISLVPSVAEADVATVDGLESTIKSARDWKQ
ncbi:hypothetical protein B296_00050965 [Ensete ventricosum]|uniref:Uncharacterized protein n=1 Tax=Ensete ventricosum TaxID=4639 RepID=A0A426XC88_ENSVE|nr:hypothetical protein B296_00050965 [Ensete ventricosum]